MHKKTWERSDLFANESQLRSKGYFCNVDLCKWRRKVVLLPCKMQISKNFPLFVARIERKKKILITRDLHKNDNIILRVDLSKYQRPLCQYPQCSLPSFCKRKRKNVSKPINLRIEKRNTSSTIHEAIVTKIDSWA